MTPAAEDRRYLCQQLEDVGEKGETNCNRVPLIRQHTPNIISPDKCPSRSPARFACGKSFETVIGNAFDRNALYAARNTPKNSYERIIV